MIIVSCLTNLSESSIFFVFSLNYADLVIHSYLLIVPQVTVSRYNSSSSVQSNCKSL